MIFVEPCQLFVGQQVDGNGFLGYRTESERFELIEFAELCFLSRDNEQGVLDTDTMTAGFVDTWLIGDNHAWFEECWHVVHADLMRTFVDAEEMADAMTGAVQVVDAAFPHGTSGKYVKLGTASSGGELGILKLQMPFQY